MSDLNVARRALERRRGCYGRAHPTESRAPWRIDRGVAHLARLENAGATSLWQSIAVRAAAGGRGCRSCYDECAPIWIADELRVRSAERPVQRQFLCSEREELHVLDCLDPDPARIARSPCPCRSAAQLGEVATSRRGQEPPGADGGWRHRHVLVLFEFRRMVVSAIPLADVAGALCRNGIAGHRACVHVYPHGCPHLAVPWRIWSLVRSRRRGLQYRA